FFFSSRRRHTRFSRDWSSDVCSSDLGTKIGKIISFQKAPAQILFITQRPMNYEGSKSFLNGCILNSCTFGLHLSIPLKNNYGQFIVVFPSDYLKQKVMKKLLAMLSLALFFTACGVSRYAYV